MIKKVILICLEIICFVLGIMYILGAWHITGFSFFDNPFGQGVLLNWALGIFFILLGILFFIILMGSGKKRYTEVYSSPKKNGKGKKKFEEEEYEEEQW